MHFGGWEDDIRFPRSPKGVLHPTETSSIIYSILLKKSLFEYWQKIDFFQLFQTFHKDFSKDLWSKVMKSTCFLVRYFILTYLKDLWHNSRNIQQIFLWSSIGQHLVNTRWPKKIIEYAQYTKICELMMSGQNSMFPKKFFQKNFIGDR